MSASSSELNATYTLRIVRGATRFPERPLTDDRILIGGGSNCHLQLGGGVPILHSVLVRQDQEFWIEAVVGDPPLFVNGQHVRQSIIRPDDAVDLAGFQFQIIKSASDGIAAPVPAFDQLKDLTAEQIVDRLEDEMGALTSLEERRRQGAEALVAAARAAGGETTSHDASAPIETDIHGLIEVLRQRAAELDRREAALQSHAERLERTQQELGAQVEKVVESLGTENAVAAGDVKLTA